MKIFWAFVLLALSLMFAATAVVEHREAAKDKRFDLSTLDNTGNFIAVSIILGSFSLALLYSVYRKNQISARKGDWDCLKGQLASLGIESSDIAELKAVMQDDLHPVLPGVIGEGVGAWITKMFHKSVSGDWSLNITMAHDLTLNAFVEYYGFRRNASTHKNKLDQATRDYIEAIRQDPEDFDSQFNLGCTYLEMKKYEKSLEHYSEAIRLQPKRGVAYYWRAEVYRILGNARRFEADLAQAKELNYQGFRLSDDQPSAGMEGLLGLVECLTFIDGV